MPAASDTLRPKKGFHFALLALGVFCVGCGPVMAHMADAHPFVKCAYRFILATCVIGPISLLRYRDELARLTRRDMKIMAASGFFMSVHFAAWIAAIDYTSVASAIVLVDTAPVWTSVIYMLMGRGAPNLRKAASIVLSVVGAAIVGYDDLSFSGDALFGDVIALVGAVALSGYFICGGALRKKLSATPYSALCYGVGSLFMWALVLGMGLQATGFNATTWGAIVGMTVVAQLVGHMIYNWALGLFSAGFVSIAVLGEPICSAVLAVFLFGQIPTPTAAFGMAVLLASIAIAARAE